MDNKLRDILTRVQKPGRYTGGEPGSIYKNKQEAELRFAFCFPDTYEVGMSYLGMKILYELLNRVPAIWCERAFMPWIDMADELKKEGYPLYALESKDPLSSFDMIGFTLQYELSYSNILAMLGLSGIPLRAESRGEEWPLVVAGGPCVCNAEPIADFFDVMFLGEGEEQLPLVCAVAAQAKKNGLSKARLLLELAKIEGVYIPARYEVCYKPDGRVESIAPKAGAPAVVHKALLRNFGQYPLPENFVVPMVGAVHDRAQIEVLRGCVRGCRFCQAGFIYRPMRERSAKLLSQAAQTLCGNTGYEEVSLTSLSTSDHSELEPLLDDMLEWTAPKHINLALPSLRVDNFTESLVEKTTRVRKSGLTFAPEAGTQRLRDVINKNVSDEEIDRTCTLAFNAGYTAVKLYFMMGLPTETMEDIEGIANTAQRIVDLFYANPNKPKGQGVKVSISVACFVPKPFTPFQYCPQDTEDMLRQKQKHLLESVRSKKISVSYHDSRLSFLEAVFAKGDRRLSYVIEEAYKAGCRFDGWDDQFLYNVWLQTFEKLGIDPHFYANRAILPDEVMPWSHLDYGVTQEFLNREYQKAQQAAVTPPCNKQCSACGANILLGGACFAYH
ncbi:MAG: TIGR03960 family B12-binding radical SAM protein [Oscillospiraceae bacterium]